MNPASAILTSVSNVFLSLTKTRPAREFLQLATDGTKNMNKASPTRVTPAQFHLAIQKYRFRSVLPLKFNELLARKERLD